MPRNFKEALLFTFYLKKTLKIAQKTLLVLYCN